MTSKITQKSSTASPQTPQLVRFIPFRSVAEPSFWLNHNSRKLNELRLSEDGVSLWGSFGPTPPPSSSPSGIMVNAIPNPGMRFDVTSTSSHRKGNDDNANSSAVRRNEWIRSTGKIYSLNTVESFKRLDKNKFLDESCLPSLLACCSSNEEKKKDVDPNSALVASTCLTYCDLKSNMTLYWYAFPALMPRTGCSIAYSCQKQMQQCRLIDVWNDCKCRKLANSFHELRVSQEKTFQNSANKESSDDNHVWCPPFFLLLSPKIEDDDDDDSHMKCLAFSEEVYNSLDAKEKERVIFGFVDPNPSPTRGTSCSKDEAPLPVGWTLRNLVAYLSLRLRLGGTDAQFLSYRPPFLRRIIVSDDHDTGNEEGKYQEMLHGGNGDAGIGMSLLLHIQIPLASDYEWPLKSNNNSNPNKSSTTRYRCVGWELNKNNKPGPRSVDLRPLVSPSHLARQANDLNLRLMKWRALPSLDVERLAGLKVVLLGAGTLGCGVARTLMGWGVRNITFVDSGRVSYSNPVRQSLFGIEDCKDGGKYKALAAAESLTAIAGPDVQSKGIVLTIPMPGHSFGGGKDGLAEIESVRKDVEQLHDLIDKSDAAFLLTDTRESRWLPTVMALATNTPMINSALGFDSWLVMRHGAPSSTLQSATIEAKQHRSSRLGCYFCSDVVAPENSTRDRTLDQQCTVTRPGLAPIAASMATELMVAMFHHPLGQRAPAPEPRNDGTSYAPVDDGTSASSTALGLLPHQIRGTVATYTMMTPTIPAFQSCTACSERVVEEYRERRFEFVKNVCCDIDGSYLEGVSGLAAFREEAAKKMEDCLDWDDDEEEM